MDFKKEKDRLFLINEKDETIAEVLFPEIENNVVEIKKTFVADSLKGQGIADKLLRTLAEKLDAENKKAILSCSYSVKWFESNPTFSHLIKK